MKVIATAKGYYGAKIHNRGEEFVLTDKSHFSKTWMAKPATGAKASGRASGRRTISRSASSPQRERSPNGKREK